MPGLAAGAVMAAVWISQPEATAHEVAATPAVVAVQKQADYTAHPAVPPVRQAALVVKKLPPVTGAVGLTTRAAVLSNYLRETYPQVSSIGGVRADPLPDHPSGHALDVMVYNDRKTGDAVLKDVLAQAQRFGVRYAIWQQQIYYPSGYHGWMGNRGTPTLNHYDHVHITVW